MTLSLAAQPDVRSGTTFKLGGVEYVAHRLNEGQGLLPPDRRVYLVVGDRVEPADAHFAAVRDQAGQLWLGFARPSHPGFGLPKGSVHPAIRVAIEASEVGVAVLYGEAIQRAEPGLIRSALEALFAKPKQQS